MVTLALAAEPPDCPAGLTKVTLTKCAPLVHNPVVLATRAAMPQKQWQAFALGYTGHLICDLWGGSKVPWFAPFESQRRATRNRWPRSLRKWAIYLLPEVVGGPIVWRLLKRDADQAM